MAWLPKFAETGITRTLVETEVLAQVKRGTQSKEGKLPFTPRAKAALQNAVGEALQLGHNYVGTEHLLFGLLSDGNAVAGKILTGLGSSRDVVGAWIRRASDSQLGPSENR